MIFITCFLLHSGYCVYIVLQFSLYVGPFQIILYRIICCMFVSKLFVHCVCVLHSELCDLTCMYVHVCFTRRFQSSLLLELPEPAWLRSRICLQGSIAMGTEEKLKKSGTK